MRVTVAAAADLGRSPRAQYHALALARAGAEVVLVGEAGTACPSQLEAHPGVRLVRLPAAPFERRDPRRRARFLAASALRGLHQAVRLGVALVASARGSDLVLVLSPPALPALPAAWLAARLRGARLAVDWHNPSFAVLGQKLGAGHPAVRALRRLERGVGRRADLHLCVSRALADHLRRELGGAEVAVLPDGPHERFARARGESGALRAALGLPPAPTRLAVCPTSWTADEDFDLLFAALDRLDARLGAGAAPRLSVVVSGRGPRRAAFERRLAAARWRHAEVSTRWLEPDDYPRLLAAADLGLCFHRSASGLDLPMKVADMRGAGLPVLAFDDPTCRAEQLRAGLEGLFFRSGEELGELLAGLLAPPADALSALRATAAQSGGESWEEGWTRVARPLLLAGRARA